MDDFIRPNPQATANIGVQPAPVVVPATPMQAMYTAPAPAVMPAAPLPFVASEELTPVRPVVPQPPTIQGFTPVSRPAKRRRISVGKAGIIFGFTAFMLLTVGAAFLFNQGQKPITTDQSNARGVVVPEQDLGASVILADLENNSLEEEQTLIVNGDIRLQGSLDFASGGYLASLVQGNLSANQTYTLPDASGELCLSSNNCSFLTAAQLVATGLVTADQLAQAQNNLVSAAQLAQLQSQVNGIVATTQPLSAGSGISIVGETIQNTGVLTLNGQSGALTLTGGSGILVSGSSIANTGVLTVNGQTGAVSFAGGSGISLSGTTINNDGVLSLAGQTGALNLVSGPGISISGLTVSNNGVTSTQGLTGNVVFTAGAGIDITGTAVSNTGVTLLTGTANQVAVSGGTGSVTLSLPQDIAVTSTPTFGGLTLNGTLNVSDIASAAGLTVGTTAQPLTLRGSTASLSATNGANTMTLTFVSPSSNVTYRFINAAAGTYDVCTTTGNCSGVGGGVTTSGGTPGTIAKFTSSQGLGDSLITDDGTKVTINGDFDVTGVINGQLVSSDAHFTGNVTVDLNVEVSGTLTVNTITPTGAMAIGSNGQTLLMQGSAVTISSTDSGITNSLVFATPAGSNKTITLPNASGTVCLTSGNCAGVGGTGDVLQGGNSYGTAMTIGTNDNFALNFETNGGNAMTILTNGNVSIGTGTSGERLNVNGGNIYVQHAEPSLVLDDTGAGISWGIRSLSNGDLTFRNASSGTRYMTIQSDGDVGIGIADPGSYKLNVAGDAQFGVNGALKLIDTGSGNLRLAGSNILTVDSVDFRIRNAAGSINTAYFDNASQEVGIGTTSPEARLHVSGGNILLDNTYSYQARNNAATAINLLGLDASNHLSLGATSGMGNTNVNAGTGNIAFTTSGGTAMTILNGGNVGVGHTAPDSRLSVFRAPSNTVGQTAIGLAYTGTGSGTDLWGMRLAATSYDFNIDRNYSGWSTTPAFTIQRATGNVGIGEISPGSKLQVNTETAATIGLIIKGAASQTANLQEWHNIGGLMVYMSAAGSLNFPGTTSGNASIIVNSGGAGTGSIQISGNGGYFQKTAATAGDIALITAAPASTSGVTAQNGTLQLLGTTYWNGTASVQQYLGLQAKRNSTNAGDHYLEVTGSMLVNSQYAGAKGLIVRGAASQTANLQEWQNSAGTVLSKLKSDGAIAVPYLLDPAETGAYLQTAAADAMFVFSRSAGNRGLVIRGAASQTANLQEWQNSSGNMLSSVKADGSFQINSIGTTRPSVLTSLLGRGTPAAVAGFVLNDVTSLWDIKTQGTSSSFTNIGLDFIADVNVAASAMAEGHLRVRSASSGDGVMRTRLSVNTQSGKVTVGSSQMDVGRFNVQAEAASEIPAVIRGAASQTANLQEWQNSAGSVQAIVNADGLMGANYGRFGDRTFISYNALRVTALSTGDATAVIRAMASQTGDLQQWQNSAGTVLTSILPSGRVMIGGGGSDIGPMLGITAANAGTVGVIVRGAASQTGDLQRWTDSGGTILTSLQADGKLAFGAAADTNLYRSAADTLRTDDNFRALSVSATDYFGFSGASGGYTAMYVGITGEANYRRRDYADGSITWGNGTNAPDTSLYRSAADTLSTDDRFTFTSGFTSYNADGLWHANALTSKLITPNGRQLRFGYADDGSGSYTPSLGFALHSGASNTLNIIQSRAVDGTPEGFNRFQISQNGQIGWGSGTSVIDTNLYRSAADTLRTDDSLSIGGATSASNLMQVTRAAGAAFQAMVAGDSVVRLRANVTGSLEWGDGTSATDINLFRAGANTLQTNGLFHVQRSSATAAFATSIAGDVNTRMYVHSAGGLYWSDGVGGHDTNLYRSAADTLTTDDTFQALGGLKAINSGGTGLTVVAGTPGVGAQAAISAFVSTDTLLRVGSTGGAAAYSSTSNVYGISTQFTNSSTGNMIGINAQPVASGPVTIAKLIGVQGAGRIANASGVVTDMQMFYAASPTVSSGTVGSSYGLYVEQQKVTGVGNGWGIYQAHSADNNYLAGALGIGTTSMTATSGLNFAAGTTVANGIAFGTDTNLYRSAVNTLSTDDTFKAAGQVAGASGNSGQALLGNVGPSGEAGISLGISNDTQLYRSAANTLKTDDSFVIQTATNSATALQIQNAAGTSLFTADTTNGQLLVNANLIAQSAPSTTGRTLTTVINSGTTGFYSSVAIAPDGFARIAYYDSSNADLGYVKCNNSSCSSSTITTIDSTGSVGSYVSMKLGSDGFARIAYYDGTNADLKYVRCTNDTCSTRNFATIDTTISSASHITLVLTAADLAMVSYQDGSFAGVKFTQCTNADCSTRNTTTFSGANSGYPSMAIGADGFARIAYVQWSGVNPNWTDTTRFIQCTNAACTTNNNNVIYSVASAGGGTTTYTAVAMAPTGYAHVIANNNSAGAQYIACTNDSCSSRTTNAIGQYVNYVKMVVPTSTGAGRFVFYESSGANLVYMVCSNAACSSTTSTTVESTDTIGENPSIALGLDGHARISYYDGTNTDLKYAACANTLCTSGTIYVGSDVGSASNYFANLYVGSIYAKNTTVTGFDLAENYHVSDMSITAGDIVSTVSGTTVEKGSTTGNRNAIGVVSTKPGITLSEWENDGTTRAIALAGRVPVKVTGPIAIGDYIALSDIPGIGTKATGAGTVLGMALTAFDGEGQGTVELFVNVHYYEPTIEDLLQGDGGNMASTLTMQGSLSIGGDLNVSGHTTLTSLMVTGDVEIAGNLTVAGITVTGDLTVVGHLYSQGMAPIVTVGPAAGAQGSVTVEGTDTAGTITITTQVAGTPGEAALVAFAEALLLSPKVQVTPVNPDAATVQFYIIRDKDGFKLVVIEPLEAGKEYVFDYFVIGSQAAN